MPGLPQRDGEEYGRQQQQARGRQNPLPHRERCRFAEWIEAINSSGLRVIAVDVPSGLDSDTGVAYSPTVRATSTVTFTLPKTGLLLRDGPRVAGDVTVADIGIPDEALRLVLG